MEHATRSPTDRQRRAASAAERPAAATDATFVDTRPEAVAHRVLADAIGHSPRLEEGQASITAVHHSPYVAAQRRQAEAMHGNTQVDLSNPTRQFRLTVGRSDAPAEREASRIAEGVSSQLMRTGESGPSGSAEWIHRSTSDSGASVGAGGGDVGPATEARIRTSTGSPMPGPVRSRYEGAFGVDFSGVRIHTDSAVAPSLQADAFTQGSDIHFASGLFKPESGPGRTLLAHELAHVVQQGRSVQRHPAGAAETIYRALQGTYAALVAVEGEKAFRAFKTHGSWTDTLQAVQEYELLEARAFAGGSLRKWAKRASALHRQLDIIKRHAESWLGDHRDSVTTAADTPAVRNQGDVTGLAPDDQRGVRKLAAMTNLLRRVAWERSEINQQTVQTPVRSEAVIQGPVADDVAGGQASRLDTLGYQASAGAPATAGYYQADVATAPVADSASAAVGIPGLDPNFGGRSMAAARLDRLITARMAVVAAAAQVASLVPISFATHTRTPAGAPNPVATAGVYLERATGAEMRDVIGHGHAIPNEAGRANAQQAALDDPVLQRSLNKLQLLDAICGQVDRHNGNFFIDQDAHGRVTRTQGIDNDMAFGSKLRGDAYGMRAQAQQGVSKDLVGEGRAWKGLPPIADREVALAIQAISPDDVRTALNGLITPAEIEATLDRLAATKQFLATLAPGNLIAPGDWDARKAELSNKQQAFNSYLGAVRTEASGGMATASATVKGQLAIAMEAAHPTIAANRSQAGVVPEYSLVESPILSDIQNLMSKGLAEAAAITRGGDLARRYALTIAIPAVDRSAMTLKAALGTIDGGACATALEQARRTMYAFWG